MLHKYITMHGVQNIKLTVLFIFPLSVLRHSASLRKPSRCVTITIIYKFTSYTTTIKTHNIECYKLVVHGYMLRPHCSHLQANLYRSSTFSVRTVWDPIVCELLYRHICKVSIKRPFDANFAYVPVK